MTQSATVILEWTFAPPNYFEERIEIHRTDYAMTVADGKAEARIDGLVFDSDLSIRQMLHKSLDDRFLGAQLLTHQPYTLSRSSMVRVTPDGLRTIFLEAESIIGIGSLVGTLDHVVRDSDGNVIRDSRKERIEKKETLFELIQMHRSKGGLVGALLSSYSASVKDPNNELVHLYEIRDALASKLSGNVRKRLGISHHEWSRFGQLANDEPLRQGRHRGTNVGALRDATGGELQEARNIALKMIENYLLSL